MSFWKKLFGSGNTDTANKDKVVREADHKGFRIAAMPYAEAGQYQVAGRITKEADGVTREHRFVRADRFASLEDAADVALMKARQMIDQQGERIFD
ncbi:MAG: HlyU family transcriptional regulator [Hyphomicrobiaceae bacterium]